MTDLFDGRPKQVLHVAPERCFEPRLKKCLGLGYLTADLLSPRAMVKMDIAQIQYPAESFDIVYCSHVLEHVPEDQKAMAEIYRVLKPHGWAVLNVPISADKTIEDPTVVTPADRLKVFGQSDHVRRYGPDYIDRLRLAGFKVKVTCVTDMFEAHEAAYMGLTGASGDIYYCTKT
jgi:SAM-dependent methyltransferase